MATGWYVLHIYSGFENKIEKKILDMIERGELDKEVVRGVKVPRETVVEIKDGKKRSRVNKFLPGYILVEMDLPENNWKPPCLKIRGIDGVTGFVGTPPDKRPHPLSADEMRSILQKTGELKGDRSSLKAKQMFSEGEQVKIIDGPFESFTGVIEEVEEGRNKLKVMVGIFGRNTPVEVDLLQVERV
jgi:transcriptional antiterminator NusG